jgi:AcrR family transcriptional regulator
VAYLSAEERRRTIIDAAIEVIAQEGLARATTRRIAERANAPLGALHYCFRNKDELIQVVADEGAQMLDAAFDDVDPSVGFEQTLRDSIAALWQWVEQNSGLQMALLELAMWRIREADDSADLYEMWQRFGGDLLSDRLSRALEDDPVELMVPLEEIVRFINHRFDGLILEFAASRDADACRRQTEMLADAMLLLSVPGTEPQSARSGAGRPQPASP